MSKPKNRHNERQSDSHPWIKNEWRAESKPGNKERVPRSGYMLYLFLYRMYELRWISPEEVRVHACTELARVCCKDNEVLPGYQNDVSMWMYRVYCTVHISLTM